MALAELPVPRRLELAEIVRRHRVLYDVEPALEWPASGRVVVGYDVDLFGTHRVPRREVLPGCRHCVDVWNDLRTLAQAVMPSDLHRTSSYSIAAFDHSLYTQGSDERDDVRLELRIRHQQQYFAPLDQCEHRCMHDIVSDLEALGAQQGRWSERVARQHVDAWLHHS